MGGNGAGLEVGVGTVDVDCRSCGFDISFGKVAGEDTSLAILDLRRSWGMESSRALTSRRFSQGNCSNIDLVSLVSVPLLRMSREWRAQWPSAARSSL